MEDQGTKDGAVTGSKADQKKDSTEGPLSETEVCSDFGFIEPDLKYTTKNGKVCELKGTWIDIHDKPISTRDGFIVS